MLPARVAEEIRDTLLDYLRTTWSLSNPELEAALFRFLESDRATGGGGIFQGPYVRVRLPFEPAASDAARPLDLEVPYTPYKHQLDSWQRLSTKHGREPRPTLVVTGTGSGKTEAFAMPILDHCLRARARKQRGIKAIVLYPMNALAADQARRLAQLVHGRDDDCPMRGKVRVGMYVGGAGGHKVMGPEHVIDDRKQLRLAPPDILLTNYKMLDFLLLRPADRALWELNSPETLRYLVLDELHTYDGAQGTDVACLIRRLSERLGGGRPCPVGTSATVTGAAGAGHDGLLEFASKIFEAPFEPDAVIGETRRSAPGFFGLFGPVARDALPDDVSALPPRGDDSIDTWVARCAEVFFGSVFADGAAAVDRVRLGERLARHPVARRLIAFSAERIATLDQLDRALCDSMDAWAARSGAERRTLLDALLAMLSWARRRAGGREAPLVSVQVQSWVREVRHLVQRVAVDLDFRWRDERPDAAGELSLPMYYCRACGHAGWVSRMQEVSRRLEADAATIGRGVLQRDASVVYLHRDPSAAPEPQLPGFAEHVCPQCKRIGNGEACSRCSSEVVPVHVHRAVSGQIPPRDLQRCPACSSEGALSMLASRAASLASVAVGHLYTSPFNEDQKLLAFSDSVQDASHRAGFFSGRTYRFSLRTAILDAVPRDGAIELPEVAEAMMVRWAEAHGEHEMVAAFTPRDIAYLPAYQSYLQRVGDWAERAHEGAPPPLPSSLRLDLHRRLRWEVTRELGLAARIGRTLERVGCAGLQLNEARFGKALERLLHVAPNQLGELGGVPEPRWRSFISGLLARLRARGGIHDELLSLFFARQGHRKYLSKKVTPLLSPFGRFTSKPTFLTAAPEPRYFDSVRPQKRDNWYSDWARRSLGLALSLSEACDLYALVLPLLVDAGLLVAHEEKSRTTWGIDPRALRVARDPVALICDVCNFNQPSLEGDPAYLLDAPCLRFRCPGKLRAPDAERTREQTYYRRFYERGRLGRVWAEEHTGLLEREAREQVEHEFIHRHRPDAPNLLSCTPTLEMGIDIGDLSATMLVSVPPTTSSYLQRIGRAGRETGNALVLTFSTVRPHDLYFFDDPEALMVGAVEPPGCYLDAPAILRRQALAWCLDAWARDGSDGKLPARVRDALTGRESERFPAPLFRFLEGRREVLRESFLRRFGASESTREALFQFLAGSGYASSPMEQDLAQLLSEVVAEKEVLTRIHRRVKDQRAKLAQDAKKVENAEEELEELAREQRFLERELVALQDQPLLGLLGTRGRLPNYAFPEAGVELRAYVSKERGAGGRPDAERLSWTRAASTALRELAPFNTFYGSARKVRVDTIDVGSARKGKRGEHIQTWQLCSECGHMAHVTQAGLGDDCPRCRASDWREKGRTRELVRMARVSAFARQRDATVSDETEDRRRAFYITETFFDPDPGTAKHAWLDRATPFGFELLPRLVVRELNFGRLRAAPQNQRIGGRNIPDVDFWVCEECGRVHDEDDNQSQHRRWCTIGKREASETTWRRVHLFREVTTEAIRVLVPVVMRNLETRLPNLRAAIELGMRRFFGGAPSHILVRPYDEPSEQGRAVRRRFVVLYDAVPGGTGVLAELAHQRGAKLRQVLQHARDALAECPCREHEAPACYRCLYAHRHQREFKVLNRAVALDLVEQLLSGFDALEPVKTIGTIDLAQVTESELEDRFLDILGEWARETEDASLEDVEPGQWSLRVGTRLWRLEAQVTLDAAHGVARVTRPDFVLWPADDPSDKAVAVYCDGAAYHVQPHEARARLAGDLLKREAVVASGNFRVCALAWPDLDEFLGSLDPLPPWVSLESTRATAQHVATQVGGAPLAEKVALLSEADPMSALLAYLCDPKGWDKAGALIALAALAEAPRSDAEAVRTWAEGLSESERMPSHLRKVSPGDRAWSWARPGDGAHVQLLLHAATADLGRALDAPSVVSAVLRIDDRHDARRAEDFEVTWRTLLRASAALQELPGLRIVSTEQLLSPLELAAPAPPAPILRVAEPREGGLLTADEARELDEADESIRPVLARAVLEGFGVPEIPYEHWAGASGFEHEISVGWASAKVGVCTASEASDAAALRALGWIVLEHSSLTDQELLAALRGER